MTEPTTAELIAQADRRKARRAAELVARGDLRIQIVQRELDYVLSLNGSQVQLADFGAALVIAALDSFDETVTADDKE